MNNEGDYLNFANELKEQYDETQSCLLYTSDAADE